MKVADNLAQQTRESSKLKSVDSSNTEEISRLRKELENVTQVFSKILQFIIGISTNYIKT